MKAALREKKKKLPTGVDVIGNKVAAAAAAAVGGGSHSHSPGMLMSVCHRLFLAGVVA